MYCVDGHCYKELTIDEKNFITDSAKYVLPQKPECECVVDVYKVNCYNNFSVISRYEAIRHGSRVGSIVIFETNTDYNPKFIWTGREWLLQTFGPFVFAEQEITVGSA